MRYLVQIVATGEEWELWLLERIATACNATELERYCDKNYFGEGDHDYRFLAYFDGILDAETFDQVGKNASVRQTSCVMVGKEEFEALSVEQITNFIGDCVYLLWAEGTPFYKIGKTSTLKKRIASLDTACPHRIEVIHVIACKKTKSSELELALHKKFSRFRRKGEWFELSESEVAQIKAIGVTSNG
jgi:hypothetical protein